jgi:hypothetical protein
MRSIGECRLMVDSLSLAHDRGCEAELASVLTVELATARLPDKGSLRARIAPSTRCGKPDSRCLSLTRSSNAQRM